MHPQKKNETASSVPWRYMKAATYKDYPGWALAVLVAGMRSCKAPTQTPPAAPANDVVATKAACMGQFCRNFLLTPCICLHMARVWKSVRVGVGGGGRERVRVG